MCCILGLFNLPFSFSVKHLKRRLQNRGVLNKYGSDQVSDLSPFVTLHRGVSFKESGLCFFKQIIKPMFLYL